MEENVEIHSLSSILNLYENGVYCLTQQDIETIVNFKKVILKHMD